MCGTDSICIRMGGRFYNGKEVKCFFNYFKKGEAPVKIKLTGLEILDIREQCYFITFSVDNKIGELVFIK